MISVIIPTLNAEATLARQKTLVAGGKIREFEMTARAGVKN